MDGSIFSRFWSKPQKSQILCMSCAELISFNPTKSLCSDCSYRANIDVAQSPKYSMSSRAEQDKHENFSPMTPANSLKRSADVSVADEFTSKRTFSDAFGAFTNGLFRPKVSKPATPTHINPVTIINDEPEEEFEDALEDLSHMAYGQNGRRISQQLCSHGESRLAAVESDCNGRTAVSKIIIDPVGVMGIEEDSLRDANQKPELLHSTFGRRREQGSKDNGIESACSDNDDNEKEGPGEGEDAADQRDSSARGGGGASFAIKDATGASNSESFSRPKITTQDHRGDKELQHIILRSSKVFTGPRGPDPARDLSKNLKLFEQFKNKAIRLIPQVPLSKHRYWIGVLYENVKAKDIRSETDFVWMKGNRLTTILTVWHSFSSRTASEDFVLLLGYERPELTVRMEEVDYFSEKKIILRAVNAKSPFAKGRELIEGLIPEEVIEID